MINREWPGRIEEEYRIHTNQLQVVPKNEVFRLEFRSYHQLQYSSTIEPNGDGNCDTYWVLHSTRQENAVRDGRESLETKQKPNSDES